MRDYAPVHLREVFFRKTRNPCGGSGFHRTHADQMDEDNEQQDAAWELLKKAQRIEIKPFFAQETRRLASSAPQGFFGAIFACFGINGRRPEAGAGPLFITGGRFAVAGITLGVIAAAMITLSLLKHDETTAAGLVQGIEATPGLDATAGSRTLTDLVELPEAGLAVLPEVASLEKELDAVDDLLHLASTLDVSSLADDEIEALLF